MSDSKSLFSLEEWLLNLAEAVEKYSGDPRDRTLVEEIALAVGWHPPGVDPRLMETDARWLYLRECPDYLWSLDAAKRLLLAGWDYLVGVSTQHDDAMVAEMWPRGHYSDQCIQGQHPTMDAASLTAAALRVRACVGETTVPPSRLARRIPSR